jgi:putative ABC transport system permease protein
MLRSLWLRVRKRRQLERDLQDELAYHLEMRQGNLRAPFGNPTLLRETLQDMWTFRWIEVLSQDLRYAARMLRKNPGFAVVVILTLALGIGANTAIFSVFDATVLRPLPYPDQSRLVELWGNVKRQRVERRGTSLPDYADWRDQNHSFDAMALFDSGDFTLTSDQDPEQVRGEIVAQPYFQLLGVQAVVGRTFRPEEDQVPLRDSVVILSGGLWKRRFGGDPAIVGRTLRLDNYDYLIVGVLPDWFRGITDAAELWIPLNASATPEAWAARGNRGPAVLGRLRPGVSLAQAQSEMDEISKRLEREHPDTNQGRGVELSPLTQELFGDVRRPLTVLLVAVGLVLLIGCANVANLLLVRSESRQREIAVRTALGAGRGRVFRQLITESLLLALLGGSAGLLLAKWGIPAMMAASPIALPSYIQPGMDPRVALFTIAITCGIGLLLGLAPATHVYAEKLSDVFKQSSRQHTGGRSGLRLRSFLVAAEVAFAMLLLVGAGLLIRSLQELSAIRLGYDPSFVLTLRARMNPPTQSAGATASPMDARAVARAAAVRAREVMRHIARMPSVEAVAIASDAPLIGAPAGFYTAEGQPPVTAQNMPRAYGHDVTPDFFTALRIPFVAGRTFTEDEMQNGSNAVIVSEALVRRFWPGQDPIGKRIQDGRPGSDAPWLTIVGVVNDMKYRGLPNNPTADPDLFVPLSERQRAFLFVVRTRIDPASAAPSVRGAIREGDPGAVIFAVSTMSDLVARQTARSRFTGWLMGIFAGSALLLATIGIYGVMSYTVTRRTSEIGVRMALGAARSDVLRLVAGSGVGFVAAGLLVGIAGALALTQWIESLLYGVHPSDPVTFASAAVLLAGVAGVACLVPALRACRIAPAVALRDE